MMQLSMRNALLLTALLGTAWLSWSMREQPSELVQPVRSQQTSSKSPVPAVSPATPVSFDLQPRRPVASHANLFATPLHTQPVTESVGAAPREPAALPALPFKYLGMWQQQQERKALLEYQDEVLTVSVGEQITPQYRLQSIQQAATGMQLKILYIPMNKVQTLWVGLPE